MQVSDTRNAGTIEQPPSSSLSKTLGQVSRAVYGQLAAAALCLAVCARFLYDREGPLPGALLVVACLAFFAVVARAIGPTLAALLLLLVGAAINRYTVEIFGLSVKVEQIAVLIGAAFVAVQLTRQRIVLHIDLPAIMLAGWWGLNVLAAVLHAPDRLGSLRLAAMLTLAIGAYFIVTHLVRDRATLIATLWALLAVGAAVAAHGILAHLLYPFGLDLGVQINPITKDPTIYGTQWEGNIFGGLCATITATALALRLLGGTLEERTMRLLEGTLLLALLGLQVSLARGAWLAGLAGIGFVAVATLILRRRQPGTLTINPRRWLVFVPVLLATSALLWLNPLVVAAQATNGLFERWGQSPIIVPGNSGNPTMPGSSAAPSKGAGSANVGTRVQTVGDVNDPTYNQRREAITRALHDARTYPVIGWGTGTFGQKYINTSHLPDWLPTVSIRVLHDTGLLGALLFHALVALIGWRAVRALWRPLNPETCALLFAVLTSLVVLTLAYEVTEGLQFTLFWLVLGLVTAGVRVAATEPPLIAASGPSTSTTA